MRSNRQDIAYITAVTGAEYKSEIESTKDTTYLAIMGEAWGAFYEYLWENWPRFNGTALQYLHFLSVLNTKMAKVVEIFPPGEQAPILHNK